MNLALFNKILHRNISCRKYKKVNYSLCLKEIKISKPQKNISKKSDYNKFYEDIGFTPTSFYKPIIKL